jgi:hypothetical protein
VLVRRDMNAAGLIVEVSSPHEYEVMIASDDASVDSTVLHLSKSWRARLI